MSKHTLPNEFRSWFSFYLHLLEYDYLYKETPNEYKLIYTDEDDETVLKIEVDELKLLAFDSIIREFPSRAEIIDLRSTVQLSLDVDNEKGLKIVNKLVSLTGNSK